MCVDEYIAGIVERVQALPTSHREAELARAIADLIKPAPAALGHTADKPKFSFWGAGQGASLVVSVLSLRYYFLSPPLTLSSSACMYHR